MATSNLDVTFEQVLKRVLNMEEREVTNNVAIEGFKMENAAIKKDLQRMEQQEEKAEAENSRLRGEMVTLSDRMKNLEAENERLKEAVKTVSGTTKDVDRLMTKVAILEGHVIPQLKNKLMKAKNETKSLKGEVNGLSSQAQDIQKGVKYMSGLRSVLSQSLVDRQNIPDLYEKVDKLGSRIDAIDGKTKSLEQVASSFLQLRGGLCKLLSQSPVDKQNFQGLYQKVDVLGSRIDAIDGKTKSLEQVASSFLQLHGGLRKLLSQSPVDKQNFQGLYQKVDVLGSRIDAIDGKTKTLERICGESSEQEAERRRERWGSEKNREGEGEKRGRERKQERERYII